MNDDQVDDVADEGGDGTVDGGDVDGTVDENDDVAVGGSDGPGSVGGTPDHEYDLLGQSPHGITVCDPSRDGVPVVDVNERFLELTGHSREAVLGREWFALDHRETSPQALAEIRDAVAAERRLTVELRSRRADGERFWDRVQIAPLHDAAGDLVNYVGFHEDVTAEKRREKSLEALHAAAWRIQDEATVDGVCEQTVRAAANILEFELCSIILRDGDWLVPRATSADAPADGSRRMRVDQGLAGTTYQTGESHVVGDVDTDETSDPAKPTYRSGLSVPVGEYGVFQAVQTETHAFDEGDVELAELLIAHTVSAIDRIERERELERQNERLESFADVVSHDLRNPLNVLGGSLDLLAETGDREHVERGKRAIDRMEQLIDDVLTLAQQGDDLGERAPVSLARVVSEAWETVSTADATVTVETDLQVRCHEGRVRQLLENLFRNAVEHGGDDVSVTVGELPDRDGFFVADDGPGIPPDERERVFESGYSTARGSTGLGLSIVEQVAEAHGWTVAVTDSDAGGTRFAFDDVDVVADAPE